MSRPLCSGLDVKHFSLALGSVLLRLLTVVAFFAAGMVLSCPVCAGCRSLWACRTSCYELTVNPLFAFRQARHGVPSMGWPQYGYPSGMTRGAISIRDQRGKPVVIDVTRFPWVKLGLLSLHAWGIIVGVVRALMTLLSRPFQISFLRLEVKKFGAA